MTEKEKLALIYRVVSGYTVIGQYVIDTPSDSLINESLALYHDILRKYRFEGLLLQEDTEYVLIRKRLWTPMDANNLQELEKSLDSSKLELYENFTMPPTQVKKIRDRIELIKKKIALKLVSRHALDRYTLEYLGERAAEIHVFNNVLLDSSYKKVDVSASKLDYLIKEYKKRLASNSEIRLVARTEPWRSFWTTNPNCFRIQGDEQKVLILFSQMYDRVYEHQDRPSEAIINDDDALDGWFLSMKKKNEQIRKENAKNSAINKHPKADHIFLMAENEDDIQNINSMNGVEARLVKNQRAELMKHKELVRDKDVPMLNVGK